MRAASSVFSRPGQRVVMAVVGLGLCAAITARLALEQRRKPERCPDGMVDLDTRCCGSGQSLSESGCSGRARSCSVAQELDESGRCVARSERISLRGGEISLGGADWDGSSGERLGQAVVSPFRLDSVEVTFARFRSCAACGALDGEPGLPVTGVSPEQAEAFCRSQGGRLPTAAEWSWAAAGARARRFAWGDSGLVCRKAAFGLEHGPCAEGGGPELAGSRPDGASPEGVLDLIGNVAEWTRELDGTYSARGGSFRSRSAAELKSWAVQLRPQKALYIGFRCAYPP